MLNSNYYMPTYSLVTPSLPGSFLHAEPRFRAVAFPRDYFVVFAFLLFFSPAFLMFCFLEIFDVLIQPGQSLTQMTSCHFPQNILWRHLNLYNLPFSSVNLYIAIKKTFSIKSHQSHLKWIRITRIFFILFRFITKSWKGSIWTHNIMELWI